MADFWNLIVQSNTFNFAILVVILAVIFAKLDLPALIEKIRNEVSAAIEAAKLEKQNAEKELKTVKKTVKNTDTEVEEKLNAAKNNAKTLSDEIFNNANEQIKQIENNAKNIILAEEKKLSAQLLSDTVLNSVEQARQNIKDALNANPQLHEKFLDESIDEISKVKL